MFEPPIPYPNNELGPVIHPPTGSFPISVDFATSASWAATASYSLGYITSASFANFAATASYLLGSIANAVSASWANFSGHSLTSDTASYSITASWAAKSAISATSSVAIVANTASYSISSSYSTFSPTSISSSYALTASYALNGGGGSSETSSYLSGSSATVNKVTLANIGVNAYLTSRVTTGIVTATPVDDFPDTDGNSAKWIISINDGTSFKTSEVVAIWEPISNVTNFAEITTNIIGSIPVAMSVNISGNQVRLIANPAAGTWTVKTIRFVL